MASQIRQVTMKYSKEKARQRRKNISDIEASLRTCEERCNESPSAENQEQLERLQMEYDSIYEEIAKDAIIRSKATWYEKGEKSNKYFLNLETHKKVSKSSVRKVFNREGVLITDLKKTLQEAHKFYSNLCKQDPLNPSEDILNSFLNNPKIPKLSDNDIRTCDEKLTADECYKSLQLFKSNTSPGNDGLTVEFYRAFWHILGSVMVDSLNCSYEYGELSNSQKRSFFLL